MCGNGGFSYGYYPGTHGSRVDVMLSGIVARNTFTSPSPYVPAECRADKRATTVPMMWHSWVGGTFMVFGDIGFEFVPFILFAGLILFSL
jgi:hypothetical protein